MKKRYEPSAVEARAREKWKDAGIFKAQPGSDRDRFYCLEMFPYPSGKLHMGHVRNYTIGDAIARFQRMLGKDVLYPMGFDAFGLPAENAAIQGKAHPKEWTFSRIEEMTAQLERMGFSYDWSRRVATCTPEYYRWNQWFFLKFWEKGIVYRKEAPVNWCPKCETVLANEQVQNGRCWRHEDTSVIQKNLAQWFFRTTDYAQRLLDNIDSLTGWPDHVREMQKHWIGRSTGAILKFPVAGESDLVIETFTTRPDTVYGITYLVLAPEHPLVDRLVEPSRRDGLAAFRSAVACQSKVDRMDAAKPKTGFALGRDFLNPFTGECHPLFVADYALMDYGTGAVMAVPAHDQRDFEFARKHDLPMREVIHPPGETPEPGGLTAAYEAAGVMMNSAQFDGTPSESAKAAIVRYATEKGWGGESVQFRLRDWLISRQRYWGTPIPAIFCDQCGIRPAKDLPVILPDDVSFVAGGNPLASSESFVRTTCPDCGGPARRETDTMDTFVDSSWYFLRYCDAGNAQRPFDREAVRRWMPVDQYIGGVEHACMHLIYARFFTMVLKDLGLVDIEEPFRNLLTQGMVSLETYRCPDHDYILPEDSIDGKCRQCGKSVVVGRVEKMSKSKKNTIDPGGIIDRYGADTARTFILFASPPENELIWSDQGVEGSFRFLRRVHDLVENRLAENRRPASAADRELRRKAHDTIVRVRRDIEERFQFNTAIAALMELVNEISSHGSRTAISDEAIEILLTCLAPIAPHLAEDRWEAIGKTGLLASEPWPEADPAALQAESIELPVQVNGKVRGRIRVSPNADESAVMEAVRRDLPPGALPAAIVKVVYRPSRILNIVG